MSDVIHRFVTTRSVCIIALFFMLGACGAQPSVDDRPSPSQSDSVQAEKHEQVIAQSYRLASGDSVSIVVFGEQELSLDVVLNQAGTFTYPYLGQLTVLNKTIQDVQDMITEGLSNGYLVNPKVSVTIGSFREIYIGGEVEQAGNFTFQPGLTVGKAIVLAGGFTERAAQSRIYVVSEGEDSSKPVRVSMDYLLKPGDVVTVKRRFF